MIASLSDEIWKDIPGYEGLYQASSLGRIKSLARNTHYTRKSTNVVRPKTEKIVRLGDGGNNGYLKVSLCKKADINQIRVHRVIAITFLPNPENKPQINHLDGDKKNNHLSNLEWCTMAENMRHAFKNGLVGSNAGAVNGMARIILDQKTGIFYECIIEAAHAKNIPVRKLRRKLTGEHKNDTSLIYA